MHCSPDCPTPGLHLDAKTLVLGPRPYAFTLLPRPRALTLASLCCNANVWRSSPGLSLPNPDAKTWGSDPPF
eukprot:349801-Chlamydomonas_euryale.AAC.71